jgi:hypothetical protein
MVAAVGAHSRWTWHDGGSGDRTDDEEGPDVVNADPFPDDMYIPDGEMILRYQVDAEGDGNNDECQADDDHSSFSILVAVDPRRPDRQNGPRSAAHGGYDLQTLVGSAVEVTGAVRRRRSLRPGRGPGRSN